MKTCVICGSELSGRQLVTCSQKCRTKRLTQSEAFKSAVSRYRASTKRHAADKAHYERSKRETNCAHCGRSFVSRKARYCSMACVGNANRKYSTALVPYVGDVFPRTERQKHAARRLAQAIRGTRNERSIWVAGRCRRCGESFICLLTNSLPAYCSIACRSLDSKARRRAVKRGAFVGVVHRKRVFERDGWRCQLCRKPVDRRAVVPHPRAATLDHIVPLADGGTHEPSNVQCAHFLCNSRKGDRGASQQLMLFG